MRRVDAGQQITELTALRRELMRFGSSADAIAANVEADSPLLSHPLFRPQHRFLEFKEKLYVDRVFKAETWKADLDLLQTITGIQLRSPDPVQVEAALSIDASASGLSDVAIANLRRIYAKDFDLFGYL